MYPRTEARDVFIIPDHAETLTAITIAMIANSTNGMRIASAIATPSGSSYFIYVREAVGFGIWLRALRYRSDR